MTPDNFAEDYYEIPQALELNDDLRVAMIELIAADSIYGKVLEGGNRLSIFQSILTDLADGQVDQDAAIRRTSLELPRAASPHRASNRVFSSGWEERLVRTQLSRFYNQAVLEWLQENAETQCWVPHSTAEASASPCTRLLAGGIHDVDTMHRLLIDAYRDGDFSSKVPKIPDHPHCTHVIAPSRSAEQR